eukprot:357474-Chlamydomonas_euryale.AAC.3
MTRTPAGRAAGRGAPRRAAQTRLGTGRGPRRSTGAEAGPAAPARWAQAGEKAGGGEGEVQESTGGRGRRVGTGARRAPRQGTRATGRLHARHRLCGSSGKPMVCQCWAATWTAKRVVHTGAN